MTDNVFTLLDGKKTEDGLPQFDYLLETTEGDFKELYGFPVFTPQYLMIMRELPGGVTVPAYMTPIQFVKFFELDEEVVEEELPF